MACKNNVQVDQQLNNGLEWLLETIRINYTTLRNRVKMETTIQVFQKRFCFFHASKTTCMLILFKMNVLWL